MFFIKEPSADDDSYQVGGPEGHRGSHLPSSRQDKISKNGKCNLETTPTHILLGVGETEGMRTGFPTVSPVVCGHTVKLSRIS